MKLVCTLRWLIDHYFRKYLTASFSDYIMHFQILATLLSYALANPQFGGGFGGGRHYGGGGYGGGYGGYGGYGGGGGGVVREEIIRENVGFGGLGGGVVVEEISIGGGGPFGGFGRRY